VFTAPWTVRMEWARDDEYQMFEYCLPRGRRAGAQLHHRLAAFRQQVAAGEAAAIPAELDDRRAFANQFDYDPAANDRPAPPGPRVAPSRPQRQPLHRPRAPAVTDHHVARLQATASTRDVVVGRFSGLPGVSGLNGHARTVRLPLHPFDHAHAPPTRMTAGPSPSAVRAASGSRSSRVAKWRSPAGWRSRPPPPACRAPGRRRPGARRPACAGLAHVDRQRRLRIGERLPVELDLFARSRVRGDQSQPPGKAAQRQRHPRLAAAALAAVTPGQTRDRHAGGPAGFELLGGAGRRSPDRRP
jgi:hypothetical protein